jgi:hypothetical protein
MARISLIAIQQAYLQTVQEIFMHHIQNCFLVGRVAAGGAIIIFSSGGLNRI